jgi:sigma-B regulation protein RsbU (phosphoserine phosphatase)
MPLFSYSRLRSRLLSWYRRSRLARFTTYIFGVDLLLYLMQKLFLAVKFRGTDLHGWVNGLTFVGCVLLFILLVRWFRQQVMWRLRNRLIVTYIFIGVIPVILVAAMAAIAGYLFAGQFAAYIVTNSINSQLDSLQSSNNLIAHELTTRIKRGESANVLSLEDLKRADRYWEDREIAVSQDGRTVLAIPPAAGSAFPVPAFAKNQFHAVVRDHDKLFLRAVATATVDAHAVTIVSSEPLGRNLLEKIAADLGQVTLYSAGFDLNFNDESGKASASSSGKASSKNGPNVTITDKGETKVKGQPIGEPDVIVGKVPPPLNAFDRGVEFPTAVFYVDWSSGSSNSAVALNVRTRGSRLYDRLFSSLGRLALVAEVILAAAAIAFAFIELFAIVIGWRLTRTITRSVASLYSGTQRVNRGDFSHRIEIKSQDQLAALEGSFNSMTESIERLLAEQKEKQRMENELAIAQEVQSQLFPKQISELESLEVFGFCRPARTVSGDYYDFLPQPPERLTLAVGDISGKGISAALLMATIHSAVRAYTLEEVASRVAPVALAAGAGMRGSNGNGAEMSPATLVTLLNKQLYHSTPPEKYATLFLSTYDAPSRLLTYTNAGHLPPVLIGRDGDVRRLDAGGTVVGLFDGLSFDESSIRLNSGDIFLAFSDGVTEPENDFGEFGEERLISLVSDYRDQPLPRISEAVVAAVMDWIGGAEQPDDVTIVLARAR